jgi:hypothetical protein
MDNTQAFFSKPIMIKNVYTVYSSRKFIGVPDGGYLIGLDLPDTVYEKDYSSLNSDFLLKSLEFGTNYSYLEYKKKEKSFIDSEREMSELTRRILCSVNYQSIKSIRRRNFSILHSALGHYNRLSENVLQPGLKDIPDPYCYPFLIEHGIRELLVQEKIYIPALWQEILDRNETDTFEYYLSGHLLCLPIDQRYSEKDMQNMINILFKYLGE